MSEIPAPIYQYLGNRLTTVVCAFALGGAPKTPILALRTTVPAADEPYVVAMSRDQVWIGFGSDSGMIGMDNEPGTRAIWSTSMVHTSTEVQFELVTNGAATAIMDPFTPCDVEWFTRIFQRIVDELERLANIDKRSEKSLEILELLAVMTEAAARPKGVSWSSVVHEIIVNPSLDRYCVATLYAALAKFYLAVGSEAMNEPDFNPWEIVQGFLSHVGKR